MTERWNPHPTPTLKKAPPPSTHQHTHTHTHTKPQWKDVLRTLEQVHPMLAACSTRDDLDGGTPTQPPPSKKPPLLHPPTHAHTHTKPQWKDVLRFGGLWNRSTPCLLPAAPEMIWTGAPPPNPHPQKSPPSSTHQHTHTHTQNPNEKTFYVLADSGTGPTHACCLQHQRWSGRGHPHPTPTLKKAPPPPPTNTRTHTHKTPMKRRFTFWRTLEQVHPMLAARSTRDDLDGGTPTQPPPSKKPPLLHPPTHAHTHTKPQWKDVLRFGGLWNRSTPCLLPAAPEMIWTGAPPPNPHPQKSPPSSTHQHTHTHTQNPNEKTFYVLADSGTGPPHACCPQHQRWSGRGHPHPTPTLKKAPPPPPTNTRTHTHKTPMKRRFTFWRTLEQVHPMLAARSTRDDLDGGTPTQPPPSKKPPLLHPPTHAHTHTKPQWKDVLRFGGLWNRSTPCLLPAAPEMIWTGARGLV